MTIVALIIVTIDLFFTFALEKQCAFFLKIFYIK